MSEYVEYFEGKPVRFKSEGIELWVNVHDISGLLDKIVH